MQERQSFDLLVLYANDLLPSPGSQPDMSPLCNMLWNLSAYSYAFRKFLGDSYRQTDTPLSIRSTVWQHLESRGITSHSSACVTTNWDDVLWNHNQIKTVAHLHGLCLHPEMTISLGKSEKHMSHRGFNGIFAKAA